jgi:tRNA nucleotidyltransferase (CCA-adding enzyme)
LLFVIMNSMQALKHYLPPTVFSFLQQAGTVAAQANFSLYLIGGSIRDMLLERPFDWDIDLVTEESASKLAQQLQAVMGGDLQTFPQYGTAKLRPFPGFSVDIATARTETYAHPGANPEVTFSTLAADLARRDFTINAMALDLGRQFGTLIDVFDGQGDLQRRQLVSLHAHKFMEDPVRSWRAVRLAHSLDFSLAPDTHTQIAKAMGTGLFDGFCSERIRQELNKILAKPIPGPYLQSLDSLGVLRSLHPELHLSPSLLTALERLPAYADEFPEVAQKEVAQWLLLITGLSEPQQQQELFLHLLPSRHQQRCWQQLQRLLPLSTDWQLANSQLDERLDGVPPEVLWTLLALTPDQTMELAIQHYWRVLRHRRSSISGTMIAAWVGAGPQVRSILKTLRQACLDETVNTPEEELALARQLVTLQSEYPPA